MAQSMDFCQYCGDMIDASYAGICERCYDIENGNVDCFKDGCSNKAIRVDFKNNPICKECGEEE